LVRNYEKRAVAYLLVETTSDYLAGWWTAVIINKFKILEITALKPTFVIFQMLGLGIM